MIRFDILTLFPEIFVAALEESMLKKARESGLVRFRFFNIRDWSESKHKTVDDTVFGGGDGMVMKPDVLRKAILAVRPDGPLAPVILLSPQGKKFDQERAQSLSRLPRLVLVCGRYGGIDQRAVERLIDEELSIGDYVLSGGELPALVVIEALTRLVPGVLGNAESAARDSFPARLEFNQYTRPRNFEGDKPPEILTSGDHQKVEQWRKKESLRKTLLRRPDLLLRHPPAKDEAELIAEIKRELMED